MLGVRGVRLAVLRPALYRMQVRALVEARSPGSTAGDSRDVRVLVPLVTTTEPSSRLARRWIDEATTRRSTVAARGRRSSCAVGAMVETPRAALRAGELAELADFLSSAPTTSPR